MLNGRNILHTHYKYTFTQSIPQAVDYNIGTNRLSLGIKGYTD